MVERHWKTKHPSKVYTKNKFSSIPVKGQGSLFTHGFSPNTLPPDVEKPDVDEQEVLGQIDVEKVDVEFSGDKRQFEDIEDYDSNLNKRVRGDKDNSLELKVDAIAKDVKCMIQKFQASDNVESGKRNPGIDQDTPENDVIEVQVDQILGKCKTIGDLDESIEALNILKENVV